MLMMMTVRQGYRISTFFTAATAGGSEVGFHGLVGKTLLAGRFRECHLHNGAPCRKNSIFPCFSFPPDGRSVWCGGAGWLISTDWSLHLFASGMHMCVLINDVNFLFLPQCLTLVLLSAAQFRVGNPKSAGISVPPRILPFVI